MKNIIALATLAVIALSGSAAHAGTAVSEKGRCLHKHNSKVIANKVCNIIAGVTGVDGAVWYEVDFSKKSTIRIEIPLTNPKFATVNGYPASVKDLGSRWQFTVVNNEEGTDRDIYQIKKVEM